MEGISVKKAELHEALVHALTTPIVAVDRSGFVVEWNRAAETCTGIGRTEAIGQEIWHIQARIAPARIPYEDAVKRSHQVFTTFLEMSESAEQWTEACEGEILSASGDLRRIHSHIFPLWLNDQLIIVGVLSESDTEASDPDGSFDKLLEPIGRV